MRRAIAAVIAALLLYLVLLFTRLPAAWLYAQVADKLPFQLGGIQGSVWEGSGQLLYRGIQIDSVHWQLAFWPLLVGRQELELRVNDRALRLQASLQRDGQQVEVLARDLWLDVSRLNRLKLWPAGVELAGELSATELKIMLVEEGVQQASGQLLWAPAYLLAPQGYSHPGFVGELRSEDRSLALIVNDRGGDVAVEGIGWLTVQGEWRYRFYIQPGPNTTAGIERVMQQLGRRDAQGRYQLEGSGRP